MTYDSDAGRMDATRYEQVTKDDMQVDEGELEVEAKVAEIEATRDDLSATVEAIGEKLDPANIVQGAKETVREATVGKVETMADNAGAMFNEASSTVQEAGSGILETIKSNPLPAAMAGIGLGWLLTHRQGGQQSSSSWDRRRYQGSGYQGSGYQGSGYQGSSEMPSSWQGDQGREWAKEGRMKSDGVGDKVGQVAESVGERVGEIGDTMSQVPQRIGGSAQGIGQQAQRMIQESPLAAGAAALAVGAALGMVLPSTKVEQDLLGPTTGKLVQSAEQTATQALQEARTQQ